MAVNRIIFGSLTAALVLGLFQIAVFAQGSNEYVAPVVEGDRQPRAATPEVGLSNLQKINLGTIEADDLAKAINRVENFVPEYGNYGSQPYTIFKDASDPDIAIKVAAVHRAVKIIIDRGIRIPQPLRVYCINKNSRVLNQAWKRTINFAPAANITLVTIEATVDSLSARANSFSGFDGLDKATITMIHEIGHILHERHAGEFFWTRATVGDVKSPTLTRQQISTYAAKNKKEFVAEMFTGLVLGMKFSPAFIAEYREYRGRPVW